MAATLDGYRPLPSEQAIVADFRALLGTPQPASRDQFFPGHLTASGFVLSPDRDSLLLVHHRRLERWLQPGGHIDPEDASPAAAAVREVGEEAGVDDLEVLVAGLFTLDHHPIPARGDEPPHRHYDLGYAFVTGSWELEPSAEVHAVRWVPLDEVAEVGVDRAVHAAVAKLRELD